MNNPEINIFGDKVWKNEQGQYHREDGPAQECRDGAQRWFINGKLHRENGPAYVGTLSGQTTYQEWFFEGTRIK